MGAIKRRDFLKTSAVGAAALGLPGALGCAGRAAVNPAAAAMEPHARGNYFESQFGITKEMIRKVLAAAGSRGGDFADVYFQHDSGFSVGFEDEAVNRAMTHDSLGVGIRVVAGEQTGYAFTEELTVDSMVAAARTAASIAANGQRSMPPDLHLQTHPARYDTGYDWQAVGVAEVKPLLERVHHQAKQIEPGIIRVNQMFSGGQSHVMVVDSAGRMAIDSQPMTQMRLYVVIEKNGIRQANGHGLAARAGMSYYTPARINTLMHTAIARTNVLFDAGRPPAGEMPVVLAAGSAGILLHEAIGHGMEADFNRKGVSIFSDKINRRVAIDDVTIVDDGTNAGYRGSINFDDEGNTAQATRLVERGMLRTYLHDRISARHYGLQPTGNGRRQSFRHLPMPRMRNTYMLAGSSPKEELIRSVKNGIYCIAFTNGQVNIGAGDYSFYVKNGYLIENGRLTQPIKDVNIIGNGPESLARIAMVGNDFEMDDGGWTCGKNGQTVPVSLGMPTVLVSRIVVGGRSA